MWLDIATVVGYVLLLTVMGLRGGRRVKGSADFTASGGRYGSAVIFASLSASFIGGGYSAGNAAEAFSGGIGMTVALFGFSLSMILVGIWLVPGVSRFPDAAGAGDIIGRHYGRTPQIWTGLFSFLCCAGVVGAQMKVVGTVLNALLGIPPWLGVLLGGAVILVYSTFGGLQSVITADVVQFVLLVAGIPLLAFAALRNAGGLSAVLHAVPDGFLNPLHGRTPLELTSLFLAMLLGETLAPPYTQRLLIGKNVRGTACATIVGGLFSIPFFLLTGLIGLIARVAQVTTQAELAMPALILAVLPVGLRGLVMAAMVSVTLSAADSFLNSAAVALVKDTMLPLSPHMSDAAQLRRMRLVNLLTGVLAVAAALLLPNVFSILTLAYTLWSPLVLVPLAAALLGVRANSRTFAAGALTGLSVTLLWTLTGNPLGIDAAIPGTLAHLIAFALARQKMPQSGKKFIAKTAAMRYDRE